MRRSKFQGVALEYRPSPAHFLGLDADVVAPEDRAMIAEMERAANKRGDQPLVASGLDAAQVTAPRRRLLDARYRDIQEAAVIEAEMKAARVAPPSHYDRDGNPV